MLNIRRYHLYSGDKVIGQFIYSDKLEISLVDNLRMIDIPMFFYKKYTEGQRAFKDDIVREWVCSRVIPSGRQNISEILREIGLEEYDELGIFMHFKGRFSQDEFRIEEIK